jgi:hypothetical protein
MAEHRKSSKLLPIVGLLFALGMLCFEGGVWRIIVLITVGLVYLLVSRTACLSEPSEKGQTETLPNANYA